ncbi:uncharacterized protein DS421_9g262170 [Arachis hypogaea]|nr:uncharacterized protein DS421_9g262170 [Arachis hypogaea]
MGFSLSPEMDSGRRKCRGQRRKLRPCVLTAGSGSVTSGITAGAPVDPPELLAAAGAVTGAGSESQLPHCVISCCYGCCESGWELRFWLPSVRVEAESTL